MPANKPVSATYRNIGIIVLLVLLTIAAFYLIKKKSTADRAQNACMKLLEQAATAARNETSEKHAQIIFAAMAKPECKGINKPET